MVLTQGWASSLSGDQRSTLEALTTPRLTDYIPYQPTQKQAAFLCLDSKREVFYGGAAAGGKSDALLMAALQYVDTPGYAALILRRNFKQLSLPGALMHRSHAWLDGTDARWQEGRKRWTFPSGATLTFGYLGMNSEDRRQYESAEFQYVGVDELTAFDEHDYRFMFSRLRRLEGAPVPIRMRSASNPGGRGHSWVKGRFVDPDTRNERAVFIKAFLWDNPHVDQDEYVESLRELHPTLWQRLLHGDWDAADPGEMFQPRLWLDEDDYLTEPPDRVVQRVRYWDLAASEPTAANPDPDWTACARFSRLPSGLYALEHVMRIRKTSRGIEQAFHSTAAADPPDTVQWIEQEPGASGKNLIAHYRRTVAPEQCKVRGDPARGSKALRARPLAGAMENHRVKIVKAKWNDALFDEMEAFSDSTQKGAHDDQVDACSGAFDKVRVVSSTGTSAGVSGSVQR